MRYRIKGGPLVLFAQMFCFLYLNLKESNPAYLSEKNISSVWLGLENI